MSSQEGVVREDQRRRLLGRMADLRHAHAERPQADAVEQDRDAPGHRPNGSAPPAPGGRSSTTSATGERDEAQELDRTHPPRPYRSSESVSAAARLAVGAPVVALAPADLDEAEAGVEPARGGVRLVDLEMQAAHALAAQWSRGAAPAKCATGRAHAWRARARSSGSRPRRSPHARARSPWAARDRPGTGPSATTPRSEIRPSRSRSGSRRARSSPRGSSRKRGACATVRGATVGSVGCAVRQGGISASRCAPRPEDGRPARAGRAASAGRRRDRRRDPRRATQADLRRGLRVGQRDLHPLLERLRRHDRPAPTRLTTTAPEPRLAHRPSRTAMWAGATTVRPPGATAWK